MVSEVSVHGRLAFLLWQHSVSWREQMMEKLVHLMVARKQRETGRGLGPSIPSKGMILMT
jgi:hypothetical protein